MKKRKLTWDDIKKIVEFKTLIIVIALSVLGVVFFFIEYYVFSKFPNSVLRGTFSSLGITFITSSTVSLIMEIFLRLDIVDFMSERMLAVMPEEIKGNTGVCEFHSDRKRIDFKEHIINADGFLKIIGVSANDILASANLPIIKEKLKQNPQFRIEILLLTPWSVCAEIRSAAKTYKSHNEGIVKTQAVIMDICNLVKNMQLDGMDTSCIQLRLYDDIPSLSMVIDNQKAIVAPFMVVQQGGSSPYYIARNINVKNNIYDLYCEHFDSVWENAVEITEKTSFEDIYTSQQKRDEKRIHNNPNTYSKWVLSINNINIGGNDQNGK